MLSSSISSVIPLVRLLVIGAAGARTGAGGGGIVLVAFAFTAAVATLTGAGALPFAAARARVTRLGGDSMIVSQSLSVSMNIRCAVRTIRIAFVELFVVVAAVDAVGDGRLSALVVDREGGLQLCILVLTRQRGR